MWATEDELLEQQVGKLSKHQQVELDELLQKWKSVLKETPGETSILDHSIDSGDVPPVRAEPYQIPDKWRDAVREEIGTLKQLGILVPSTCPWGSPIVPVAKKDGGVRVCADFRRVNKITVKDPYLIALVQEIVSRVGNSRYLSKLDLNKGFHQVRMTKESRQKTAVVTPFGKLEFTKMPFELVNTTSTFQRLMVSVLEGMHEFCAAYVDDILIYSGGWKEHLRHVDLVMKKLDEAGLTAKQKKCECARSRLVYLGHDIGEGRVAVPEDRVTAIANFVKPTTIKGVRVFLGTSGYYRKFVPGYGQLANPLTEMTKKAAPEQVHWTPQAFVLLRESLCNTCMLSYS